MTRLVLLVVYATLVGYLTAGCETWDTPAMPSPVVPSRADDVIIQKTPDDPCDWRFHVGPLVPSGLYCR